jgi:hypothetical protein
MREEADFEMTQDAFGRGPVAKRGEHFVRFFIEPIKDDVASNLEARPIYRDAEFIEIRAPGDGSNVIVSELNDYYKGFFREQYGAWKRDHSTEGQVGTPLSAWPLISRAQVEELKFFRITTVEHLANLTDSNLQMGFRSLRDKAKLFLDAAAEMAPLSELQDRLDKQENEIEALRRHNDSLSAKIKELEDA